MPLSSLARLTGLLGGLAWLLRWPLDGAAAAATYWIGFVLLAVSLAAYGAGLVKAGWLQAVTGPALPVLVWSVLVVLRGDGGSAAVDALFGLGMVVLTAAGLARSRNDGPDPVRSRPGARAAGGARRRTGSRAA